MSHDPLTDYEEWRRRDRRNRLWSAIGAWIIVLFAVTGFLFFVWVAVSLFVVRFS